MYLWKVGIPLQSKSGNQLSSRDNMGCTELYLSCCAELGVPETGVSGNLWSCLKEVKPLVVFDGECGWLWSQSRGIRPHLDLIRGTLSYFALLR